MFTSKLFSEMFFLFYAYAFDDVMKFEKSRVLKFEILENEKSFWSEIKSISPCLTSAHV